MKKSRKVLSLMLSVLMLMTMLIPTAFAYADGEEVIYFEEEYAPDGFGNAKIEGEASADVDWEAVFASMAAQFEQHAEKIDFSEFNIPKTTANKNTLYNFCWYYPQNLKGITTVSMASTSTKYCYLTPSYSYTDEEYFSMIAECEDAIETLLYGIEGNTALSDDEKLLILHDRMATWCEYDYANYLNDSIPDESYCAYGPLVLKLGVCEGISLAYGWMLDRLGIENYYTTSDAICHGWNMVYVNGEAYYVDITHDDPVWDRIGRVEHDYFLVTYSTYSAAHSNATDFSNEPDSTYFEENGFWNESGYASTEAQIINGKIYYIKNNSIVARDCATDAETTVKTLSDVWYSSSGGYYSAKFHCLASIGTKLIYNTPSEIRSYDTVTGEDTLIYAPDLTSYDAGTHIYALTQKEGVIYYWLNNTPNQSQDARGTILTYNYCTEHTSSETLEVITPATCTTQGESKFICKDCRAVFTAATGTGSHSYTEFVEITQAATCQANAQAKYKCANCDATITVEVENSQRSHDYTGEYSVTETTHSQKCVNGCNKYGEAVEHSYDTLVGTKTQATCTADRVDTYKCVCGATKDITVENTKTGHVYNIFVETKSEATCTADRVDTYKCVCGLTKDVTVENTKTEHKYDTLVGVKSEATCTADRVDTYKCVCGATKDITVENTKTGHVYNIFVETKSEATCTADRVDTYKCVCGATEDITVANTRKEHNYNTLVGVKTQATCMADRVDTYKCVCGATKDITVENTKTGHVYNIFVETKSEATCTADRVDTYKCVCGLTKDVTVENTKTEHKYDTLVGVKSEATCTADRVDTYKCVCGATEDRTVANTRKEHNYNTLVGVKKNATCTTDRIDTYKCVCGATKDVTVENTKTGHSYVTVETVAPTCTEKGYSVYSCSNCGDTYKADYTDAKGHNDGNGDGACDECGTNLKEASCSCGCHKSGISGFFFKIKLLFWKLFNIESHRYCDCGKAHW